MLFEKVRVFVESNVQKREDIQGLLKENGAMLMDEIDETTQYRVVDSSEMQLENMMGLCEQKPRVIGSQCVIDSVERKMSLPETKYPICSRALESMIVCVCPSMEPRAQWYMKIIMMNGKVDLTTTITTQLVISDTGCSKEARNAQKMGIPVISSSWLDKCWEDYKRAEMEDYKVGPFKGCIISMTGFTNYTRKIMAALIVELGGVYSADLTKRCTHLVSEVKNGIKYRYAYVWGTKIVSSSWIFEASNTQSCPNEQEYTVDGRKKPNAVSEITFADDNNRIHRVIKVPFISKSSSPSLTNNGSQITKKSTESSQHNKSSSQNSLINNTNLSNQEKLRLQNKKVIHLDKLLTNKRNYLSSNEMQQKNVENLSPTYPLRSSNGPSRHFSSKKRNVEEMTNYVLNPTQITTNTTTNLNPIPTLSLYQANSTTQLDPFKSYPSSNNTNATNSNYTAPSSSSNTSLNYTCADNLHINMNGDINLNNELNLNNDTNPAPLVDDDALPHPHPNYDLHLRPSTSYKHDQMLNGSTTTCIDDYNIYSNNMNNSLNHLDNLNNLSNITNISDNLNNLDNLDNMPNIDHRISSTSPTPLNPTPLDTSPQRDDPEAPHHTNDTHHLPPIISIAPNCLHPFEHPYHSKVNVRPTLDLSKLITANPSTHHLINNTTKSKEILSQEIKNKSSVENVEQENSNVSDGFVVPLKVGNKLHQKTLLDQFHKKRPLHQQQQASGFLLKKRKVLEDYEDSQPSMLDQPNTTEEEQHTRPHLVRKVSFSSPTLLPSFPSTLERVDNLCNSLINKIVTVDTVCCLCEHSFSRNSSQVLDFCLHFLASNFDKISPSTYSSLSLPLREHFQKFLSFHPQYQHVQLLLSPHLVFEANNVSQHSNEKK